MRGPLLQAVVDRHRPGTNAAVSQSRRLERGRRRERQGVGATAARHQDELTRAHVGQRAADRQPYLCYRSRRAHLTRAAPAGR